MAAAQLALPIAVLYAELHDLTALDTPFERNGGGSFAVKRIKGGRYWYRQHWAGRRRVQQARRRQLVRSLKTALGFSVEPAIGRILTQLAAAGLLKTNRLLQAA